MKFKKNADTVLVAVFMLALILPLLCVNFSPGTVSEAEQRTLNAFPALYKEDGSGNEQFWSQFQDWFNDNVGFREKLYTANKRMQYDLFNSSASERVVVGRDGWLYFTGKHNVDMAAGYFPDLTQKMLEEICAEQQAVADRLAGQGIEYVLLLAPSKTSIYPEHMRGDFQIRTTPVDSLADYLEEHSDLKVVRMKQALLEEKERTGEQLYYKTDTHWNMRGSYAAYREAVRRMKEWGILDGEAVEVEYGETTVIGDLTRIAAGNDERYLEPASLRKIKNTKTSQVTEGETYDKFAAYAKRNVPTGIYRYFRNENQGHPRILMAHDSFGDSILDLLAENSAELAAVFVRELSQELLDIVKPEVVIVEVTERLIPELWHSTQRLLQTPATIRVEENWVDIYYRDDGLYEAMWVPAWCEGNWTDDAQWYQASRIDERTWYARVDLANHPGKGLFWAHFYAGDAPGPEGMSCIDGMSFRIRE